MKNKSNPYFSKILSQILDNTTQKTNKELILLKATWINTLLGPMVAIADEEFLYLLEFTTKQRLHRVLERLRQKGFAITPGTTAPLVSIEKELKDYFEGKLTVFKTPCRVLGSPFQQQVWNALSQIPYGETRSYAEQSASLGRPKAYRAVANANGANQLAIMVPCHRVIAHDGTLGGYGGGLTIKEWLINHEKTNTKKEIS